MTDTIDTIHIEYEKPTTLAALMADLEETQKELDNIPTQNMLDKVEACGQQWSCRIEISGTFKRIVFLCKDYRLCPNCRFQKYERGIEDRLAYAENHLPPGVSNLQYLYIKEDQEEAFLKSIQRYDSGLYLRIPQPEKTFIIIHNTTLKGKPLLDYDYLNEDDEIEGLDLEFNRILQDVPRKMKISGNLGKKLKDTKDKPDDNEDEDEAGEEEEVNTKEKIKIPHLFKEGLTTREANISFDKAVGATQNISVATAEELEKAMFARCREWKKLLETEDTKVLIYHTDRYVSEEQVTYWNNNQNNGVVQVVPITNTDSSNVDNTKFDVLDMNQFLEEFLG